MSSREDQNDSGNPVRSAGFARFMDKITDSWFNDDFRNWPEQRNSCRCWPPLVRFAFAFAGSSTSGLAFFIYNIGMTSIDRQQDQDLWDPFQLLLSVVVPMSVWFAFLVSYRNRRSGPTRLYLSGFLLPAFVWTVVNYAFVRTS